MMNTIKPDLKFTPEFPEYFPDQKVPTLDTKVWMESNRSPTSSYRFLFEFIQSQCPQSTVNLCPQPELGPPSCLPYPKRCTGGSYTRALTFPHIFRVTLQPVHQEAPLHWLLKRPVQTDHPVRYQEILESSGEEGPQRYLQEHGPVLPGV